MKGGWYVHSKGLVVESARTAPNSTTRLTFILGEARPGDVRWPAHPSILLATFWPVPWQAPSRELSNELSRHGRSEGDRSDDVVFRGGQIARGSFSAKVLSGSTHGTYPRHHGSWRCRAVGTARWQRDDEERDEVNGEVEGIRSNAHSTHESWRWPWDERRLKLEPNSVRTSKQRKVKNENTYWQRRRETTKTKDLQCMKTHALASTTLTDFLSVSSHFTHCWAFRSALRVTNSIVVAVPNHSNSDLYAKSLKRFTLRKWSCEVLSLHTPSVTRDRRQL